MEGFIIENMEIFEDNKDEDEENEVTETFDIATNQQLEPTSRENEPETVKKAYKEPKEHEDNWDIWIKAILPKKREFAIVDDDVISLKESDNRIISFFLILCILQFVSLLTSLFIILDITKGAHVLHYQVPDPSNPYGNRFNPVSN